MLFAVENSFTAFIDQMWANWVLSLVECLVEGLLLGKQDHSPEVWQLTRSSVTIFLDGPLNVVPNVRGVISVEINDSLGKILNSLEVNSAIGVFMNGGLLLRQLD